MALNVRSLLRHFPRWSANPPNVAAAPTAQAAHDTSTVHVTQAVQSDRSEKLVDVAMSAYGKPWNTAATIASLMTMSGRHIDKIYLQIELDHPDADQLERTTKAFQNLNILVHRPSVRIHYIPTTAEQVSNPLYRRSIRYQQAWEDSDKRFLFVCHNDCVFHTDIVGGMLHQIEQGNYTGVGRIGQCWNCFAHKAGQCDGDRFDHYRPTVEEALALEATYGSAPRPIYMPIDHASPMPLPECRLNEFGCLIDLERARPDVAPLGEVWPLGAMGLDTGTPWFRGMVLKGHKFKNWFEGLDHAPFSPVRNGTSADHDVEEYERAEKGAAANIETFYPDLYRSLATSLMATAPTA